MTAKPESVRGCLLGMAVGDAMGHTVDAKSWAQITADYGPNGLLGYDLFEGYADVTSYTQVAAFTANALLLGATRGKLLGRRGAPILYISTALREWSRTQQYSSPERNYCWLTSVPQIRRRFCMDNGLLDALSRQSLGTLETPVFQSVKPSCLPEAIPIALLAEQFDLDENGRDLLAAQAAVLTHGESEAFLSCAVLAHAFALVMEGRRDPQQILQQTVDAVSLQFGSYPRLGRIWEVLQYALTLSRSETVSSQKAMELLGCRTAPEVLAGALYACSVCQGDFDRAMITAVNHSGRSAAVGAVTGAVLGAALGEEALPDFYLDCLEPAGTLRTLADDMAQGGPNQGIYDDDWDRKYLNIR